MIIDSETQLLGLLGWPVAHSHSPAMHNAAAHSLGLNVVYLPLPVAPERLNDAVRGVTALGFRGVNVTIPHKQAVMATLDHIDDAALAIGAVNTVVVDQVNEQPVLTGYNTDWSGFSADLAANNIPVAGRDCIVLGAGGSARAVVYALAQAHAHSHLFARRQAQAHALIADLQPWCGAAQLTAHPLDDLGNDDFTAPLIINTTPLGMSPHGERSPWPEEHPLPLGCVIYDLVYNPRQTRLMQQAHTAGHRAVNGLGMLLRQGAQAFVLWTGHEPDLAVMADALHENATQSD